MSTTVQTGYFFMPEHIILVGASERPHSLGERIFSHLLGSSYQGKITPVNSFEFHRCRRTPQVDNLTLSLRSILYIAYAQLSSFTAWTTRVSNPV